MNGGLSVVPTLERRLEFLRDIDLPRVDSSRRIRPFNGSQNIGLTDDRTQSAILIGKAIFNAMEGLSREERTEIKNSIKLAELECRKPEYQRLDLPQWLEQFSRKLNYVGWYSDRHPGERSYKDLSGGISQKMIDVVAELGNEPMLDNSLATFAALNSTPAGLSAYAQSTLYGKSFQVMPAGRDSQGKITLVLNHARLQAQRKTSDFLFFRWQEGEAILRHNFRSFYLDRDAYAQTKREVEDIIEANDMAEIELRLK